VIEGLRSLFGETYELVGAVSDGRALIDAAKNTLPDVIVLDISMPLLNGLDAARVLRSEVPEAKIVFLTMHADRYFVKEAFRAGASGYLLKQAAGEELISAIEQVMKGRRYISPLITDDILSLVLDDSVGAEYRLRPRQREVLQLIAEGKQMKEIAAILKISRRTAESHKYEMMRALNITTNAELIQHAIRIGLVSV
jgi:DNA-binding NarL/FixJ family response regulator